MLDSTGDILDSSVNKKGRCQFKNSGIAGGKQGVDFSIQKKHGRGEYSGNECQDRQPKPCKWYTSATVCTRSETYSVSYNS